MTKIIRFYNISSLKFAVSNLDIEARFSVASLRLKEIPHASNRLFFVACDLNGDFFTTCIRMSTQWKPI